MQIVEKRKLEQKGIKEKKGSTWQKALGVNCNLEA